MNSINNINTQIDRLERELSVNYGRITPINREQINIDIARLKIQRIRILQNDIRNNNSNDPIDRIEFEKLNIMGRYYDLEIQQCNLKIQQLQRTY